MARDDWCQLDEDYLEIFGTHPELEVRPQEVDHPCP